MLKLSKGLFVVACVILAGFLIFAFLSGIMAIHLQP
jgi:hypothetical protein